MRLCDEKRREPGAIKKAPRQWELREYSLNRVAKLPSTIMSTKREAVQVVIRCRPLWSSEEKQGFFSVVKTNKELGEVSVGIKDPNQFTFDSVFGTSSQQSDIFEECARPIVDSVMEGYNGTIFAYGQTGTGKTYTMEGPANEGEDKFGITPRSFNHIIDSITIAQDENASTEFMVSCTFVEIYKDNIVDLLNTSPGYDRKKDFLKLREKKNPKNEKERIVYVENVTTKRVQRAEELFEWFKVGQKSRSTGETAMNKNSSRSHCIFTVTVECSETGEDKVERVRMGKLNLVDLAGSERQEKTHATGERFEEATKINLALSALGNVIAHLTNPLSKHTPYRDSKLTRLLQNSLGGNARTVMIANIGPANYNEVETTNTLRWASRAKRIENQPHINEDPVDAQIRKFKEELEEAKRKLAQLGGPLSPRPDGPPTEIVRITRQKVYKGVAPEKLEGIRARAELEAQKMKEHHAQMKASMKTQMSLLSQKGDQLSHKILQADEKVDEHKRNRAAFAQHLEQLQGNFIKIVKDAETIARQSRLKIERERYKMKLQKLEEEKIQRKLMQEQLERAALKEKYTSLEQELSAVTQVNNELRKKRAALKDLILQEDMVEGDETEQMLAEQQEFRKNIEMYNTILTHFVPPELAKRVSERAKWDPQEKRWRLTELPLEEDNRTLKRPQSVHEGCARPTSLFALQALAERGDARFRRTNIIDLEPTPHERTTEDLDFEEEEEEEYEQEHFDYEYY